LLIEDETDSAILVDAPAEENEILAWVAPYTVQQIVLTHGHIDHVGALEQVRNALDVPVAIHPADVKDFNLVPDQELMHGDKIHLGAASLEVVHIPGHTQGSIALKVIDEGSFSFALVGDAIFPGGPGHTKSNMALQQSLEALEKTVFTWQDTIALHPGHGGPTTVGDERVAFEAFRSKPLPPDLYGDVLWR
jgi:glyoxylase-like metal-dependent hydrolase (beta-lactamase superfamily II)